MSVLTEKARYLVVNGTPEGVPDSANPFQQDGGTTWLRFDSIILEPDPGDGFGDKAGFLWAGEVMAWSRLQGPSTIQPGKVLRLVGIEGRQRVFLGDGPTVDSPLGPAYHPAVAPEFGTGV